MIVRKKVVVKKRQGLHARPAALFVQIADEFKSEITVRKGRMVVDGKSILGILMLGAEPGNQVEIRADGDDAGEAVEKLKSFLST